MVPGDTYGGHLPGFYTSYNTKNFILLNVDVLNYFDNWFPIYDNKK